MKTSTMIWTGIAVLAVVLGGWYFMSMGSSPVQLAQSYSTSQQAQVYGSQQSATNQTQPQTQQTITSGTNVSVKPSVPAAQKFTVNGNDSNADLTNIIVPKGTPVTITFGADSGTTYHGGLDFRSSVVSTGTITPGNTKTISFVANQSFSFTPYWPSTNIAKPYTINITVQ